MSDIATIFQTIQLGVESTPGTAVAANKKLLALGITPGIKFEGQPFRPMGNKFPTVVVPGKEYVESTLDGVGCYQTLIYPLSGLMSGTATQQGTSTAYSWAFNVDSDGPDSYTTYTVEQGSSVRAHEFAYGIVTGVEFDFSRDGIGVTGSMIGNALTDNVSMTGAPTEVEPVIIKPTTVNVYLADTQAGLDGATALDRTLNVNWSLDNRFGPIWPLKSAYSTGWGGIIEIEPGLTGSIQMEADDAGMALLTNMRAGSTKFLRVEAVDSTSAGDSGGTTYYYTMTLDTAIKIAGDPSEYQDADGVFAIEWNWTGVHDSTWGKATSITIINTQSEL